MATWPVTCLQEGLRFEKRAVSKTYDLSGRLVVLCDDGTEWEQHPESSVLLVPYTARSQRPITKKVQ